MRAVLLFSVLRVLAFAVPLGILLAIGLEWWISALIAAAVGFCVSYIFLTPLRERVARQLVATRSTPEPSADERAEDSPPPAPPAS